MTVLVVGVVIVANGVLLRYEETNNNIVLQQKLKDLAFGLATDSYNGFKTNDYSKYNQRLASIEEINKQLDASYRASKESEVAYRGLKNSLNAVTKDIEETRKSLEQSEGITDISSTFERTSAKFEFVQQNTEQLILAETENLAQITENIQKLKATVTIIILGVFTGGVLGSLLFAFFFSKKLTQPIIELSHIAQSIAQGSITLDVSQHLLKTDDEIGHLSQSIDTMVKRLRKEIDALKIIEHDLVESKKELETQNEESERMNKLMIGRELKMVELKEQVEKLSSSR